jgi:choloylglycine hydrolase
VHCSSFFAKIINRFCCRKESDKEFYKKSDTGEIMNNFYKLCLSVVLLFVFTQTLQACTGIVVTAKDKSVIYTRTMEFAIPTDPQVLAIPRGYKYKSLIPSDTSGNKYWDGLQWTSKYNVYGLDTWSSLYIIDGINEKGLAFGAFYFPGYAKYQSVQSQKEAKRALTALELGNWILGNFENVSQVKLAIKNIKVTATAPILIGKNPVPLRFTIL